MKSTWSGARWEWANSGRRERGGSCRHLGEEFQNKQAEQRLQGASSMSSWVERRPGWLQLRGWQERPVEDKPTEVKSRIWTRSHGPRQVPETFSVFVWMTWKGRRMGKKENYEPEPQNWFLKSWGVTTGIVSKFPRQYPVCVAVHWENYQQEGQILVLGERITWWENHTQCT